MKRMYKKEYKKIFSYILIMSESYRVCIVFTLKDQHSKDRFITFCNGEKRFKCDQSI